VVDAKCGSSVGHIVVCLSYRYPHELFCLTGTPYLKMLWVHQTLSVPVYLLSAVTEGTDDYNYNII